MGYILTWDTYRIYNQPNSSGAACRLKILPNLHLTYFLVGRTYQLGILTESTIKVTVVGGTYERGILTKSTINITAGDKKKAAGIDINRPRAKEP